MLPPAFPTPQLRALQGEKRAQPRQARTCGPAMSEQAANLR